MILLRHTHALHYAFILNNCKKKTEELLNCGLCFSGEPLQTCTHQRLYNSHLTDNTDCHKPSRAKFVNTTTAMQSSSKIVSETTYKISSRPLQVIGLYLNFLYRMGCGMDSMIREHCTRQEQNERSQI